jgi:hypothetical protein
MVVLQPSRRSLSCRWCCVRQWTGLRACGQSFPFGVNSDDAGVGDRADQVRGTIEASSIALTTRILVVQEKRRWSFTLPCLIGSGAMMCISSLTTIQPVTKTSGCEYTRASLSTMQPTQTMSTCYTSFQLSNCHAGRLYCKQRQLINFAC